MVERCICTGRCGQHTQQCSAETSPGGFLGWEWTIGKGYRCPSCALMSFSSTCKKCGGPYEVRIMDASGDAPDLFDEDFKRNNALCFACRRGGK